MTIKSIVWRPEVIEMIASKHQVSVEEVEEIFKPGTIYRKGPRGKRKGENLYKAYGQTEAGRYLFVLFIYKLDRRALIMSARDMNDNERNLYQKA